MARTRAGASTNPTTPLLAFLCDTLKRSGCELLNVEGDRSGFFRLAFEDPLAERYGLLGSLFRLQPDGTDGDGARMTLRPPASPDDPRRERDPFRVFTSVLLGVDPVRGLFVAFDPARHFPEDTPLRVSIGAEMLRTTLERGWHSWLREDWEERDFDFAEALVGFRSDRLFHYVHFERIAEGLDTPCRERLAEEFLDVTRRRDSAATSSTRRPQGLRDIRDAVLRLAGGQGRAKREARRAVSLTAEDRGARELRVAFGTDLVQDLQPLRGELRSPWTSPVSSAPALL